MNFFKKIISFISESYAELKKVSWPSKDDVVVQTVVVVVSLIVVSGALFVTDMFFLKAISWIITFGNW